jgi:hypothetical protein
MATKKPASGAMGARDAGFPFPVQQVGKVPGDICSE